MAYFERTGEAAFRATEQVGGAWDSAHQHIAPALGLLAHIVELDRDRRRDDGLVIGRVSYDILGPVPVDTVQTSVRVLRPGRTIELVEAALRHDDRDVVLLRAWLMRPRDTSSLAGTTVTRIPAPDEMAVWDGTSLWPGGFVASVEIRRAQREPGRASFWVRTPVPLVSGEHVSRLARTIGLLDIANGITVRTDPNQVLFPNVDLTAHLFGEPDDEWVGFDTTVSFGPDGIGLTSSVIYGTCGPIGTVSQILTVRPG